MSNPFESLERNLYFATLRYPEMKAVTAVWWNAYCKWDKWESDNEDM